MSQLLLIPFLLACLLGALAAFRVRAEEAPALARIILLLCSAGIAAALIVAAEAGSATARYLGLAALLLTSAAFTGTCLAARRSDSGQPCPPRP